MVRIYTTKLRINIMPKLLTVIIPEHNEGDQVNDTLDSLFATSDRSLYDVIVISDGSTVPLDIDKYKIQHFNNGLRQGVGAAFDVGVMMAKTPYLILMGCDIRFREDDYINKMLDLLRDPANEKAFICTTNLGMHAGKMDINSPKLLKRYGSSVLLFMTAADIPAKGTVMRELQQLKDDKAVPNYRNILECKWLSRPKSSLEDIPGILGAFYGVRREWYNHIRGWRGHRYWGTLEPFISLKSWLCGGSCKITTDIETGHIFSRVTEKSHKTRPHDLLYNKMYLAEVLFDKPTKDIFMDFLGTNMPVVNTHIQIANYILNENRNVIDFERKNMELLLERDLHWFNKKFPFKYYDLLNGKTLEEILNPPDKLTDEGVDG